MYILKYLLTFRKHDESYNKILITAALNKAADKLTEKLDDQYNYTINFKTDILFIIIRYHFLDIKVDVVSREYKN